MLKPNAWLLESRLSEKLCTLEMRSSKLQTPDILGKRPFWVLELLDTAGPVVSFAMCINFWHVTSDELSSYLTCYVANYWCTICGQLLVCVFLILTIPLSSATNYRQAQMLATDAYGLRGPESWQWYFHQALQDLPLRYCIAQYY